MKHLKIILPLLLCGLWSFSQTVTPNPGPYTPMSQKYQYPWLKTTGGIWNPGKLIVGDSAQFSGITYVIDPPDGDSSTLMANTAWVLRNSGTGGGGSNDTVITKFPLYSISGSPHDSIAVYGVDSSIQLVTAVNDSLLRFTRFNGTTFDVPVIGGAGGGGGGSGTVTNVATGYGLSGGPITTTGTLLVDTASSIASKTYVDNKDALKVNISDTAAMLSPYLRSANSYNLTLATNYIKATNDSTIYFDSTLVGISLSKVGDSIKLIGGNGVVLATVYAGSSGTGWGLTGNAGTVAGTNSLGTTDAVGMRIRTNNAKRAEIDSIGAEASTQSADLALNGTFASGSNWTTGTGWSIGSGVATKTAGSASNLVQTGWTPTIGFVYRVRFDYTRTAGTLSIAFGGITYFTTYSSASGSIDVYIYGSYATNMTFIANSTFAGTIDNVVINRVIPIPSWFSLYRGTGDSAFVEMRASRTNLAIGVNALASNLFNSTTGVNNVAIGTNSGFSNISGSRNFYLGTSSGRYNNGADNVAIGNNSLLNSTLSNSNIAIGSDAMSASNSVTKNIGIGESALKVTTGDNNVAIGYASMQSNTSGTGNAALGYLALQNGTTAADNVAIGRQTLNGIVTGGSNVAVGATALSINTSGSANVALGREALVVNTTGARNISIGFRSLQNAGAGNANTAIGYLGMVNQTSGDYNIGIGSSVDMPSLTGTGQLNIGNVLYGINMYQSTTASSTPTATGAISIGKTTPTSTLDVQGSFSTAYVAKTGTYTATISDHTIECTANTFTVTLPTAVGITGREYIITNTGAGVITVATTSSQTFKNISGTPTTLTVDAVAAAAKTSYTVKSNGAGWIVTSIVISP